MAEQRARRNSRWRHEFSILVTPPSAGAAHSRSAAAAAISSTAVARATAGKVLASRCARQGQSTRRGLSSPPMKCSTPTTWSPARATWSSFSSSCQRGYQPRPSRSDWPKIKSNRKVRVTATHFAWVLERVRDAGPSWAEVDDQARRLSRAPPRPWHSERSQSRAGDTILPC